MTIDVLMTIDGSNQDWKYVYVQYCHSVLQNLIWALVTRE